MYRLFFKRVVDIFLSSVSLVIVSPFFPIVGAIIKLESNGPVFYKQYRLGKGGTKFILYKFRTMTNKKRTVHRQVFDGDPEVTKVGRVLRRFKIDELPQLVNVLRGDMSIVGPRPSLPNLIEKFNDDAYRRLEVRPGLTGLSQINGNIYLSWEERWKYDKYYVENLSFFLDLKILFSTFWVLIIGEQKFFKNKL
jgi:lipopolysaccharide/colanic/teichoic acid biosynthesis glycosyltransferase